MSVSALGGHRKAEAVRTRWLKVATHQNFSLTPRICSPSARSRRQERSQGRKISPQTQFSKIGHVGKIFTWSATKSRLRRPQRPRQEKMFDIYGISSWTMYFE